MEASYSPITWICHRVPLICSSPVQIWRYNVLISSFILALALSSLLLTLLILIPYPHPLTLSIIFKSTKRNNTSCTSKVKQQEFLQNSTANPMGRTHQHLHWEIERIPEEGAGHQEGCSSSLQLSAVAHRLWCYTDSPPTHRSGFGPVALHIPCCHTLCYFHVWNISI